ncbi:MauE/DoxX family redox-associated membrane protein [Streptomyces sp. LUP30]|uniref:MauE/DoxX family redox-associated membrane protein n=1 Tax=Streptomyces sp. LUP30 TaxID=1890285 RepID=UPI000851B3AD|nr:MauE/DoxX family redox-associated membrane protein [Streptomyces sp. LUP30]
MAHVLISCRAFITLVFVLSVAGKVKGRHAFRGFTDSVGALAPRLPAGPAAVSVITAEALTVVLLALPMTPLAGFVLATGLLSAFSVAIGASVRRGEQVACRCFGAASTAPVGPAHLIRNAFLLAGSLAGLLCELMAGGDAVGIAGVTTSFVFGAAAAGVTLLTDDISRLFRPLRQEG